MRSHRLRVAPAKGATSPDCGNRLMKSGTTRDAPTQGQNDSTLTRIPSWLGSVVLPSVVVGLFGLLAL